MKLTDEQLSFLEGSVWKSGSGELFICLNAKYCGVHIVADYYIFKDSGSTERGRCYINFMLSPYYSAECIAPQAAIDLVVAERHRDAKTK